MGVFIAFSLVQAKPVNLLSATQVPVGFRASIELDVLRNAASVWFQDALALISPLKIPDLDIPGKGWMNSNVFQIIQNTDDVYLMENVGANALVLNCNKLTIRFRSSDYQYHVSPGITAKGYVEAIFNTVDIGFGLSFKTQTGADGRQLMAVDSASVLVDIIKEDITLHIGGSAMTDMAGIVKGLIKGKILDEINGHLQSTLSTVVPQKINEALAANNAYGNVIPNLWWDWEQQQPATVTDELFIFAAKGLMFDNRTGEVEPPVQPPTQMMSKDPNIPAKLQGFVSTYAIDSFFTASLSVADNAIFWKNSTTEHPIYAKSLEKLIPGITAKYGETALVNIAFLPKSIDHVTISEKDQKMGAKITLQLQFWLDQGEVIAVMTLVDTDFSFTALVNDMTIAMQLHRINIDKISVDLCTVGKLRPTSLKLILNTGFRVGMPFINKALASHVIQIPTSFGAHFGLSDAYVYYYDNVLALGLTPTFRSGMKSDAGLVFTQ